MLTIEDLQEYAELAKDIAKPKNLVPIPDYVTDFQFGEVTKDWDDTGYYGCLYRLGVTWYTLNSNGLPYLSSVLEIVESSWQDALMKDPTLIDKLIEDDEESTTYRGVGRGNE
tara:strand:- start:11062 stop:11400 length:339 start_codon:yes stop_codon:yes gene_type:complete